jgi:hypothetical protein
MAVPAAHRWAHHLPTHVDIQQQAVACRNFTASLGGGCRGCGCSTPVRMCTMFKRSYCVNKQIVASDPGSGKRGA